MHIVFSGENFLLNSEMSNVRATSPDGYCECGYTEAIADTCTSFKTPLNSCTLLYLLCMYPILKKTRNA